MTAVFCRSVSSGAAFVGRSISLAALLCFVGLLNTARATPIAMWTFETSQPSVTGAAAGPYSPESGAGSATGLHASSLTAYSSPAGDGSSHSFSANTWATGDYFQFEVSTVGLDDVMLSWDQTSSSTGPRDFELEYSTDGTNFTNFASYEPQVNGSPNMPWAAGLMAPNTTVYLLTDDLSSVTAINNASTVYFRLADTDTTSESGGTVGTSGTDRADNVTVTASAVPEPSTLLLSLLGVCGAAFCLSRRMRLGVPSVPSAE